jgi:hypothetical protein
VKRHLATLALAMVLTVVACAAWAYWSASSVPGGNGAAAATSVNQGATPTASASAQSVTVSWAATTLANGQPVTGYVIKRYDSVTLAAQTVLNNCAGTITTTSCTENNAPSGAWRYSVTPLIGANWQGAESARSSAVTVLALDLTPPTNSLSLSSVSGGAYLSGTTVYYRGTAVGSFRVTNAVSDAGSGPASSTTGSLTGTSTGWTHTASTVSTPSGGPYDSNPFSWSAATSTSPQVTITGRDVAGNTAATTLSLVNDSTAPTASVSYADGVSTGRSVSVTFSASDGGSGLNTRQLQRASATLTGGSCGSYGSFINIGPAGPTSPYTDTNLGGGTCYKYQYVVTDPVGNQQIATNTNAARIDYAGAVNATAGLLSQWRLGEASATLTSSDSYTGTSGTLLTAHTGEIGATWVNPSGNSNMVIGTQNRAYRNASGYSIMYTTVTPSSADYSVEADLYYRGAFSANAAGVIGRFNTSNTSFYMARWENDNTWNIVKWSNGAPTRLATTSVQTALVVGETYRVKLEMSGSTSTLLKLSVNGVQKLSVTDSTAAFTTVGKAGIMAGETGDPAQADTTGIQFENFQVTPSTYARAADSKGSNTGDYKNGVTLGAAGAMAGDTNTAATFDGVNDYVQVTNSTGLPTAAATRSVEAWFKTSSSARQVLVDYGTRANTQEFALWLDAGGSSMTAWGFGTGNDKSFALSSAVNNGSWHQVVLTYSGTSLTLYIDGVALASQAATRNTAIDMYGFGIGAVINPADSNSGGFFTGSIDEVSFYTSVLTAAQVTDHYQLGTAVVDTTGPTGGSIDATGLIGTGSRYSTSTTLSLALSKGTDSSGVATSGNQVLRATATLTNGSCGSFGSYTLVTGGNDPASPLSDTVADQACYSYQYVVSDTLGYSTTYTSPNIKVDTTAPAAPTLAFSAFTNTWWPGSGSTVYYRSAAASGSVTATATATDAASGVLSYAFPALGTNWTSTAGALGVNTYSWSGAPAAPGTKNITATNNATLASPNAPFTLTADDTAPTAGTVTYADTTQTGTSVTVSFTTGTDAASGIGTRLLQRASATLTGSTCGSYGAFATVSGGTNPTSPLVDTTPGAGCYKYQYVVSDNVGNAQTATSASVVKVDPPYLDTILGTTGLLGYWRLGESTTSSDSFTGTAGATLQGRSGEIGATWTKHPVSTADAVITSAGRIRKAGTTSVGALYYSSAVPTSADYTVEADVYVNSSVTDDVAGIVGRLDTSNANGTYYLARYERPVQDWVLYSVVDSTRSSLGSYHLALTNATTYRLTLDMSGSTIRLLVNGVERVSAVNTAITAAGRGGVALGFATNGTTLTDTTGMHLDNFRVAPLIADAKGTNQGTYLGRPTLGVAGAIAGDANTAVQFDGVDDFGSVSRQISDDFTIEFWFKSTQGIGTGNQWRQGAGLVDAEVAGAANDFGVSLRADGKVVAGVGQPDVSMVSSSGGYNNGAWHHVVFTRTKASGALQLYIDGVLAGSATGSTFSLTSAANINFGRIQSGSNYYAGSLDEVSVYTTVLSASTVAVHYNAGQ